jgi:hypothetical protein
MLSRPSLRTIVATTTAAALLVGGAQLASYATTHHGHGAGASTAAKSSQPKTITFTLGSNTQVFAPNSQHLFTAKVPKGTYAVGISGFVSTASSTDDNYTCLLVDKRALLHLAGSSGSLAGTQRLSSAAEAAASDAGFGYGIIGDYNPVAKVDRSTILYGCVFNGTDTYTVARPVEFTLTPVKPSHQKGKKFTLPTPKLRDLARAVR